MKLMLIHWHTGCGGGSTSQPGTCICNSETGEPTTGSLETHTAALLHSQTLRYGLSGVFVLQAILLLPLLPAPSRRLEHNTLHLLASTLR